MIEAEEVSQRREMSCEVFPLRIRASESWRWQGAAPSGHSCQRLLTLTMLSDESHVACFKYPTITLRTTVGKCVLSFLASACVCLSPGSAVCGELHPDASMGLWPKQERSPLVTEDIRVTFSHSLLFLC